MSYNDGNSIFGIVIVFIYKNGFYVFFFKLIIYKWRKIIVFNEKIEINKNYVIKKVIYVFVLLCLEYIILY